MEKSVRYWRVEVEGSSSHQLRGPKRVPKSKLTAVLKLTFDSRYSRPSTCVGPTPSINEGILFAGCKTAGFHARHANAQIVQPDWRKVFPDIDPVGKVGDGRSFPHPGGVISQR